jgi:phthiodiolone/phenolphthiodiolone dimycocerosates ketoreductase
MAVDAARRVHDAEAVDGLLLWDQIPNWVPRQLWTTDKTPLAAVIQDPDSSPDIFATAAYVAASVPGLRLSITTDSVRRGPAELIQTMLTLAIMTRGAASFQIGGGEAKQCKPYGHKRSQGMTRMEDLLEIFTRLMDNEGPIDYTGKHWTFEKASLGHAKPYRPKLFGLGGGPTLIKLATKYCDGLAMMNPSVYPTPAAFAEARETILKQVEANGRDPAEFKFAVWFPVLLHEEPAVVEKALQNELVCWIAATAGDIGSRLWAQNGLPSPVPEGWLYFEKFLPYNMDTAFVEDVVAKTSPEHARAFWMAGTVGDVADTIATWVEAGVDWVCPIDYATTMALGIEEAASSIGRQIEVCERLRELAALPTTA